MTPSAADERVEKAIGKVQFLAGTVVTDDFGEIMLSVPCSTGLAEVLKSVEDDLVSIRMWMDEAGQRVSGS